MPPVTNVTQTIVRYFMRPAAYGTEFAIFSIFANRLLSSLKHTDLYKLILSATSNGLLLRSKTSST
jgi:hypothetical protein